MAEGDEVLNFCKIDVHLDTNPKVRRAGRDGRDVFEFVVRRNSLLQLAGAIPLKYIEPWYLADILMMPEEDARSGVERAVTATLLEVDNDAGVVRIVGWTPEWGRRALTVAERQAKHRETEKRGKSNKQTGHVTEKRDMSRKSREVTDKIREEEIREEKKEEYLVPPKVGTPPPVTQPLPKAASGEKVQPPRVVPQEARECATRLLARILANNARSRLAGASAAKVEETVVRWADDFRKLNELDRRSWQEISAVLEWCQSDSFWASNILSGATFREKWDQLTAKMGRNGAGTAPAAKDPRVGRGRMMTQEEADAEAAGENPLERDLRLTRERNAATAAGSS